MRAESFDLTLPLPDGVAITRQPIHDRWLRVLGYELLFCNAGTSARRDEEAGIATVVVETFAGAGVRSITRGKPAHVRISRRFLLDGHAFALPADSVVLELAADDAADADARAALERLAAEEYRISIECDPQAPPPDAALARLADSLKLDVGELSVDDLVDVVDRFGAVGRPLIAAGVDTPALSRRCRTLPFDGLQGFFYRVPDFVRVHAPPTSRLSELRSLADLYAQPISFEEFERIIVRDVGLSYRLLAYLNSAFFNLPRHVASVHEALTMLGMRAVRRWAALIALSGRDGKPSELTVAALLRARLCELIGQRRPAADAGTDAFFTVGLFSVVDAIVDTPLDEVLETLPLSDDVRAALLERTGPMGEALVATAAFERGDMATVQRMLPGVPVAELYLSALRWADAAGGALDGGAGAAQGTGAEDGAGAGG